MGSLAFDACIHVRPSISFMVTRTLVAPNAVYTHFGREASGENVDRVLLLNVLPIFHGLLFPSLVTPPRSIKLPEVSGMIAEAPEVLNPRAPLPRPPANLGPVLSTLDIRLLRGRDVIVVHGNTV